MIEGCAEGDVVVVELVVEAVEVLVPLVTVPVKVPDAEVAVGVPSFVMRAFKNTAH